MKIYKILILALIQGTAELLPVSSSAHVIAAAKLLKFDPTSPDFTFLLVMLHTGTMLAVVLYFWPRWKALMAPSSASRWHFIKMVLLATVVTGIVGLGLKFVIEKIIMRGTPHAEVELLFGNVPLIASALLVTGVFILAAGYIGKIRGGTLSLASSVLIGAAQGLCLPFRGFSRSGSTISVAMLRGIRPALAEDFSFALAVVLTPPIIGREFLRLMKAHQAEADVIHLTMPGLIGMAFSFGAGLLALRWLSSWLELGRWKYFGYYCFVAGTILMSLNRR